MQKQEFTHTLIELGLLEPSNILESELKSLQNEDTFELSLDPMLMERKHDYDYNNIKVIELNYLTFIFTKKA